MDLGREHAFVLHLYTGQNALSTDVQSKALALWMFSLILTSKKKNNLFPEIAALITKSADAHQ